MTINIDGNISLELIKEQHAQSIFDMVHNNRSHLRPWLPFVDKMQTVEFAQNFVKETIQRNSDKREWAFVVFDRGIMVGRVGIYNINHQNKIGEIGYWITENAQGKGMISKSCKALIDVCFDELRLNRIEIKCSVENFRSKRVPERLGFTHEGIIRQGELLYDTFIDLHLFSLLAVENQ